MAYYIVDSDFPSSPKLDKIIWVLAVGESKPAKVDIAYIDHDEVSQTDSTKGTNITVDSTLPLPAGSAGWRVYRVRFPATNSGTAPGTGSGGTGPAPTLAAGGSSTPKIASEGDFAAIDITITNASNTSVTISTLIRLYLVVEDPTI